MGWPDVPGYTIVGELGRGGMGVVYKARQTRLNRLVALKMVRAGTTASREELDRFFREAEAVAALHHPNIVHIHEVGEAAGLPFFALEFMEGGSLAERLRRQPLTFQQAAELAETLAKAVQHAHQQGLIHRDLKPANVLLMGAAGEQLGIPKITDFGLAKRLDGQGGHTQTGAVIGTPSYMAPEQARGQTDQVGPASDVYALGAILYECLTGRPPFRGKEAMEVLAQVLADEPVAPSRLNAKVPRDLETICLKCLEKEPQRRYATAAELADDLKRLREWQPIKARRVGRLERGVRWLRRRPAVVLGVLLAVVVLAGSVGGYALWREYERRADERAEMAKEEAAQKAKEVRHEYYSALVYRRGGPEGVVPLSEQQAHGALRAFRFHRRGGLVERVDVLDRQDALFAAESWLELVGLSAERRLHRHEAFYRFSYDGQRPTRQEACDDSGRSLWVLAWESETSAVLIDQRTGVKKGVERRLSLRVRWSNDGWLAGVRFADQQGKPAALAQTNPGRDFTCEPRGLIIRLVDVARGRSTTGRPLSVWTWEFDEQGRCVAEAFLDAKGAPTVNAAGVHRFVYRFPASDRVEWSAFDARGRPVAASDTGAHRVVVHYDAARAEGDRAVFGLGNVPITDRQTGVHRILHRYTSRGAVEEELYFDKAGRPAWHMDRKCLRVTTRFDALGNVVEVLHWVRAPAGTWIVCQRDNLAERILEEANYTADGQKQVDVAGGYHRWTGRLDEKGNLAEVMVFDGEGKPCPHRVSGAHRWTSRFNARGDLVERRWFGVDGRPMRTADGGYHRLVHKHDEKGRLVQSDHFGIDGKWAGDHQGVARVLYRHDAIGNLVEQAFWKVGPRNELVLWKREDDKKRVLEEVNLTAEGVAQVWPQGYHRYTVRYDARGNSIEEAFFGLKGEPVVPTWGYHRWVGRYDENGRRVEQAHFGVSGEAAFTDLATATDEGRGSFRSLFHYDAQGRRTEVLLLGPNGRPMNGRVGWARQRYAYSPSGELVEHAEWKAGPDGWLWLKERRDGRYNRLEEANLTADGRPQLGKEGYHRWTARYDPRGKIVAKAFFGLKGEPVVPTWGTHRFVARYDDKGNILEWAHFGANDEPAFPTFAYLYPFPENGRGSFRSLFRYDARGKLTEVLLLGPNGRPRNGSEGWARQRKTYVPSGERAELAEWKAGPEGRLHLKERRDGQMRLLERANLTADGRPHLSEQGYYRMTARSDSRGNWIEEAYFGLDGKPVITTLGYHRYVARYDNKGRLREQAHFGASGEPAFRADNGNFRTLWRFDGAGHQVETLILGPDSRPKNNKWGWARELNRYGPSGQRIGRAWWVADPQGRLRLKERQDGKDRVLERANYTADGWPKTWPEGHHRWTARYDSRGKQIEEAYFGLDGKPVVSNGGFHRYVACYDDRGRKREQAHFGVTGEPAFRADEDSFRFLWRHDARGNLVEVLFLGPNGRPRNINGGWARRLETYDTSGKLAERLLWRADPEGRLRLARREDGQGRILESALLAADGRPQKWKGGYHRWKARYDSRGNTVELAYFGLDDRPVVSSHGYHRRVARYDARGKVQEEAHFGAAGEPAFTAEHGYFRALGHYDARGNPTDVQYLGPNSRPRNNKARWARVVTKYDPSGLVTERTWWSADPEGRLWLSERQDGKQRVLEEANFTADGRPQVWPEGYHRWTARYDTRGNQVEVAHFGLDGTPVVTNHVHRSVARYDLKGQLLERAYLGVAGEPVFHSLRGTFRSLRRYDSQGNLVEALFISPNGRPRNTKQGYARIHYIYRDGACIDTTALDTDGKVVPLVVVLGSVAPKSAAEALGLKKGDILLRYRGKRITSGTHLTDLRKAESKQAGPAEIEVQRGQKRFTVQAKPGVLGCTPLDVAQAIALPKH
jgi:tRNA A-37 threonylcarbamoyl transferase component Bud32